MNAIQCVAGALLLYFAGSDALIGWCKDSSSMYEGQCRDWTKEGTSDCEYHGHVCAYTCSLYTTIKQGTKGYCKLKPCACTGFAYDHSPKEGETFYQDEKGSCHGYKDMQYHDSMCGKGNLCKCMYEKTTTTTRGSTITKTETTTATTTTTKTTLTATTHTTTTLKSCSCSKIGYPDQFYPEEGDETLQHATSGICFDPKRHPNLYIQTYFKCFYVKPSTTPTTATKGAVGITPSPVTRVCSCKTYAYGQVVGNLGDELIQDTDSRCWSSNVRIQFDDVKCTVTATDSQCADQRKDCKDITVLQTGRMPDTYCGGSNIRPNCQRTCGICDVPTCSCKTFEQNGNKAVKGETFVQDTDGKCWNPSTRTDIGDATTCTFPEVMPTGCLDGGTMLTLKMYEEGEQNKATCITKASFVGYRGPEIRMVGMDLLEVIEDEAFKYVDYPVVLVVKSRNNIFKRIGHRAFKGFGNSLKFHISKAIALEEIGTEAFAATGGNGHRESADRSEIRIAGLSESFRKFGYRSYAESCAVINIAGKVPNFKTSTIGHDWEANESMIPAKQDAKSPNLIFGLKDGKSCYDFSAVPVSEQVRNIIQLHDVDCDSKRLLAGFEPNDSTDIMSCSYRWKMFFKGYTGEKEARYKLTLCFTSAEDCDKVIPPEVRGYKAIGNVCRLHASNTGEYTDPLLGGGGKVEGKARTLFFNETYKFAPKHLDTDQTSIAGYSFWKDINTDTCSDCEDAKKVKKSNIKEATSEVRKLRYRISNGVVHQKQGAKLKLFTDSQSCDGRFWRQTGNWRTCDGDVKSDETISASAASQVPEWIFVNPVSGVIQMKLDEETIGDRKLTATLDLDLQFDLIVEDSYGGTALSETFKFNMISAALVVKPQQARESGVVEAFDPADNDFECEVGKVYRVPAPLIDKDKSTIHVGTWDDISYTLKGAPSTWFVNPKTGTVMGEFHVKSSFTFRLNVVDKSGRSALLEEYTLKVKDPPQSAIFSIADGWGTTPTNDLQYGDTARITRSSNGRIQEVIYSVGSTVNTLDVRDSNTHIKTMVINPAQGKFDKITFKQKVTKCSSAGCAAATSGDSNAKWLIDSATGYMSTSTITRDMDGSTYKVRIVATDSAGEEVTVREWRYTVVLFELELAVLSTRTKDSANSSTGAIVVDPHAMRAQQMGNRTAATPTTYWTVGTAYRILPLMIDVERSRFATTNGMADVSYSISGDIEGWMHSADTGMMLGSFPKHANKTEPATYVIEVNAQDTQGNAAFVDLMVMEVRYLDDKVDAFGPNGKDCGSYGKIVDGDPFDRSFTCECDITENILHSGANCEIETASTLGSQTSSASDGDESASTAAGLAAAGGVAVLALLLALAAYFRQSWRAKQPVNFADMLEVLIASGEISLEQVSKSRGTGDEGQDGAAGYPREIKRKDVTMLQQIGNGAFGEVWKGVLDESRHGGVPGYPVAVKTVLEAGGDGEEDMLKEAIVMSQVPTHDNVVPLIGVCTSGVPLLLLVSLCEHGSVLSFLDTRKEATPEMRLKLADKLTMASDVAHGMAHLAACNFVHRDLAARNVLINAQFVCLIADFGLSRAVSASDNGGGGGEEEQYYRSAKGQFPVRWTSPEAMQQSIFSTHSDVWSLGVVICEIFNDGAKPYASLDNLVVMTSVIAGKVDTRPQTCPVDVFNNVVLKCWKYEPRERAEFRQLAEALDMYAARALGEDGGTTSKTKATSKKKSEKKNMKKKGNAKEAESIDGGYILAADIAASKHGQAVYKYAEDGSNTNGYLTVTEQRGKDGRTTHNPLYNERGQVETPLGFNSSDEE